MKNVDTRKIRRYNEGTQVERPHYTADILCSGRASYTSLAVAVAALSSSRIVVVSSS